MCGSIQVGRETQRSAKTKSMFRLQVQREKKRFLAIFGSPFFQKISQVENNHMGCSLTVRKMRHAIGFTNQVSAIVGALPETHILGTCWGLAMMCLGGEPGSTKRRNRCFIGSLDENVVVCFCFDILTYLVSWNTNEYYVLHKSLHDATMMLMWSKNAVRFFFFDGK